MKILVIQLARLGDIYQTWPVIRALARTGPDDQIDLLVREKFAPAAEGLDSIRQLVKMPTVQILGPIVSASNCEEARVAMEQWIEALAQEKYDKIINLTFSPVSSYITQLLSSEACEIKGYTRHEDGYLDIPDDVSAYFYAQVGVGRSNRVHLTQIFAGVAGVELKEEDWRPPEIRTAVRIGDFESSKHDEYLVLQPGASEEGKTYGCERWAQVLNHLRYSTASKVVLVGSKEEQELASEILVRCNNPQVINLCGQTQLEELFTLVSRAKLMVCGDTLGVHIASLTGTPVLNLSFRSVNFWETGPVSKGSRVIYAESKEDVASDRVAIEIKCMLEEKFSGNPIYLRAGHDWVAYESMGYTTENYTWHLLEAIYMDGPIPLTNEIDVTHGLLRIHELCELALAQIENIRAGKEARVSASILEQVDILLSKVCDLVPKLRPLIAWFETERVRIGPGTLIDVIDATKSKVLDLRDFVKICLSSSTIDKGESNADTSVL